MTIGRRPSPTSTKPAARTLRKALALSGNACAFPGCGSPIIDGTEAMVGEACHIRARSPGGPRFDPMQTEQERHSCENLVLLCRNHHAVVDADPALYTVEALRAMKEAREDQTRRRTPPKDVGDTGTSRCNGPVVAIGRDVGGVIVDSPGAIIARSLSLRRSSGGLRIQAPHGTIGADPEACRYVAYLVGRYNDFASADRSRTTGFSYGAISKNIENRFRSPWRLLPLDTFPEVCRYIQDRIARTRIAKTNASKGARSFLAFDEHRRP